MNPLNSIEAIIFDMDGTLVNTEQLWRLAQRDLLLARHKQVDDKALASLLGLTTDALIHKMRLTFALEDEDHQALKDELRQRVKQYLRVDTQAQAGAVKLVNYVIEKQIPCAIASNSSLSIIEATLENQSWANYGLSNSSKIETSKLACLFTLNRRKSSLIENLVIERCYNDKFSTETRYD